MGKKKSSEVEGAFSEKLGSADQIKARKKMKSFSKRKASQGKRDEKLVEVDARAGDMTGLQLEAKTLAGDGDAAGVSSMNGRRETKSSKDEIDDIFSQRKRKSAVDEDGMGQEIGESGPPSYSEKKGKKKTGLVRNERKTLENSKALMLPDERRVPTTSKRKTADGLVIYREDELNWNKKDAGGTPLCPFDCECCF